MFSDELVCAGSEGLFFLGTIDAPQADFVLRSRDLNSQVMWAPAFQTRHRHHPRLQRGWRRRRRKWDRSGATMSIIGGP